LFLLEFLFIFLLKNTPSPQAGKSPMSKNKSIYLVVKGRQPGLYIQWFGPGGAEEQVKDFTGAVYKGFYTAESATGWLRELDRATQAGLPPTLRQLLETGQAQPAEQNSVAALLRSGKAVLFTDGGALTNPGPGGYGVVIRYAGRRRELSGGFRLTTNNRMELLACIEGLSALPGSLDAVLFSDSSYVVNGVNRGWAKRWQSHNWWRTRTEKAENIDLWERLLALCTARPVDFRWVKGHAGDPDNERCDQLAARAAGRKDLPPDEPFERGQTQLTSLPLFSSTSTHKPPSSKT
jgi:ribonuclease HI